MLATFKRLIHLRAQHAVLRRGTVSAPLYLDDNVIVLFRQMGNAVAISATNNAATRQQVTVSLPPSLDPTHLMDALTGETLVTLNGQLSLTIPALFGTVLFGSISAIAPE
jgi:hypothetical protein